jgi:hypothetical protein
VVVDKWQVNTTRRVFTKLVAGSLVCRWGCVCRCQTIGHFSTSLTLADRPHSRKKKNHHSLHIGSAAELDQNPLLCGGGEKRDWKDRW